MVSYFWIIPHLGQNWVKYFYQAIEVTGQVESDSEDNSEDFWSEETEDMLSNHWLNIAIEFYLIAARTKDKVSTITLNTLQTSL